MQPSTSARHGWGTRHSACHAPGLKPIFVARSFTAGRSPLLLRLLVLEICGSHGQRLGMVGAPAIVSKPTSNPPDKQILRHWRRMTRFGALRLKLEGAGEDEVVAEGAAYLKLADADFDEAVAVVEGEGGLVFGVDA